MAVDTSSLQVRIEFLPATRIAFLRHVGSYDTVGQTYKRFVAMCGERGLLDDETRYLGIGHDDPAYTNPDKIRYDCAVTLSRDYHGDNQIQVGSVWGGEYAVTTYRGPYANLQQVYDFIYNQWLPRNNREPADGATVEIYLNDPDTTPPAQLLTGICIPLEWW